MKENLHDWHFYQLFKICSLASINSDALYWLAKYNHAGNNLIEYDINFLINNHLINNEQTIAFFNNVIQAVDSQDEQKHSTLIDWLIGEQLFLLAKNYHELPVLYKKVEQVTSSKEQQPKIVKNDEVFELFYQLFSGRENIFLVEQIIDEKRKFVEINRPWAIEDVSEHYSGEMTVAQYIIRSNKTLNYAVIDIDIVKQTLQQVTDNTELFTNKKQEALNDAIKISSVAAENGFTNYLVDSGNRGYHLWFFFAQPMELNLAYEFITSIIQKAGQPSPGIAWEQFPKQKKLKEGMKGQAIKLPWGKHLLSNNQAWFVDSDGKRLADQLSIILNIKPIHKNKIKNYLNQDQVMEDRKTMENFSIPSSIKMILNGCPIIRHVVDKAISSTYLAHQERLMLLNVFSPIGADGEDFIHYVISHTMNYNKQTTQKFINRGYSKPISCIRIREHFPSLTTQLACNCTFPAKKGRYPSPILHHEPFGEILDKKSPMKNKNSIKKDVLPKVAQTEVAATVEKEMISANSDNDIQKLNSLAQKMIELRKHHRGIQSRLRKIEDELTGIFDILQVDRLEIELGFLVRKQTTDGTKWVIEL